MQTNQFLHLKIADYLERKINKGCYQSGERLPSENELCKRFGTNHHVVRLAISRLIHTGLVTSHQGKGAFVNEQLKTIAYPLSERTSFSAILENQGIPWNGKLLDWQLRAPTVRESDLLHISSNEKIYELHIIRCAVNQPLSMTTTAIIEKKVPGLERYFPEFHSLYQLLRDHYQIMPLRSQSTIQVTLPHKQDAELLAIPENVPIIQIDSVSDYPHGDPIERSSSRVRGDMCQCIIDF